MTAIHSGPQPQAASFPTHSDRQFDPEELVYLNSEERAIARPVSGERLNMALIRSTDHRMVTYISRTGFRAIMLERVADTDAIWLVTQNTFIPIESDQAMATQDMHGVSVADTLGNGRMFHMTDRVEMSVSAFNTTFGKSGK